MRDTVSKIGEEMLSSMKIVEEIGSKRKVRHILEGRREYYFN